MNQYRPVPPPVPEEMDEHYMRLAIELAKKAADEDEVPIGAVLVHKGEVISRAYNRREQNPHVNHGSPPGVTPPADGMAEQQE